MPPPRPLLPLISLVLGAWIATVAAAGEAEVEEWELPEIAEPSGVVYHPGRATLFVVGDQGDIAEIATTGKLLRSRRLGGDLEGITCDPASGLLYVAQEGEDVILEVRPQDFAILRRFRIDRAFAGNPEYIKKGGDGIEGITYRPSSDGRGRWFVVNQNDPPVLLELDMPLASTRSGVGVAKIVGAWPLDSPPLSGVTWHAGLGAFLIPSALWRVVHVVDPDKPAERKIKLPGFMQEGVALLPDGAIVIVQDVGGLLKWTPESDPFAPAGDTTDIDRSSAATTQSPSETH